MRRRSVPLLILIMLAAMPGFVWAQPGLRIRVDDFKSNFPKLQADIRIIDPATGRDVTGLSARDVIILQDGVELKNPSTRVTTFTTSPERPVLPFGNMQLRSGGAVIGIVLDLSTLLNDPGDPHTDYNARAKEVVRWWLEAGRNVAPADPELISIFQPATRLGNEPLQPEALASFVNDRNLVMMTMEQLVPRRGATFLYDAVLAAINATAHRARERGTDAYVLIVSDGGSDPASDDLLSAINTASGGGSTVKLIAFGVGPQRSLKHNGIKLKSLVDRTGGIYAEAPGEEQVMQIYRETVRPTERRGYRIEFQSDLIPDQEVHSIQFRINLDGKQADSELIPFKISLPGADNVTPLRDALRRYLMKAIPIAILLSALVAFLVPLAQRRRYQPIGNDPASTRI